ncbi:MAG TPA: cytochrome c [Phycisphaerales bacterium]|nr:cytochrome c [Phycisphaerales bacterium]
MNHRPRSGLPARAALGLVLLLLPGCGSARRSENVMRPAYALTVDPGHAGTRAAGTAGRGTEPANQAILRGQRVFMRHCNQCHPGGMAGLGPALNNFPAPGFLVKFQVRRGLGAMPAFDANKIPNDDLDALVDYVMALRQGPVLGTASTGG